MPCSHQIGCFAKRLLPIAVVLVVVWTEQASAHVGSDEKTNNRYYKLSPMADRVRVAYTIFFGTSPGNQIRREIDSDRDGRISESESNTYREVLAREVFQAVSVELDNEEVKIRWSEVSVGLGGNTVSGGPFSVDLIGSVCLDHSGAGTMHNFGFRDSLRLPLPGETELHLDPAPGIGVHKSEIDGRKLTNNQKRWTGGAGPAARGYLLEFTVKSEESARLDTICESPKESGRSLLGLLAALFGGVLLVSGALYLARTRTQFPS